MYRIGQLLVTLVLVASTTSHRPPHINKPHPPAVPGSNPCARPCIRNAPPMECYWEFDIDVYLTLHPYLCFGCPGNRTGCFAPGCITGDGLQRGIIAINRQIPGPGIDVCLGDTIIVRVRNNLMTETVTIHWHGIHQRRTQVMDGVPLVTQFPIPPTGIYTYRFIATERGTHFYHSHSGYQKDDGVYGYLIVREPPQDDPNSSLYDQDLFGNHTIIVMDWAPEMSQEFYFSIAYDRVDTYGITVNGRGRRPDPATGQQTQTPRATFVVNWGLCYRFRFISNGFGLCPIEVSVDNHLLTVIASDGSPFQPVQVGRFHISSGERYDVVICADQTPGAYWMKFQGLLGCAVANQTYQYAILLYNGIPPNTVPSGPDNYDAAAGTGIVLNPTQIETPQPSPNQITLDQVNGFANDDYSILNGPPDKTIYVTFDDKQFDPTVYNVNTFPNPYLLQTGVYLTTPINNISFAFPRYPSLLDQQGTNRYCKPSYAIDAPCSNTFCQCTNRERVRKGDIVEIIYYNLGTFVAAHPMHLHGYNFFVTSVVQLPPTATFQDVMNLNAANRIPKKTNLAIRKDTVDVPQKAVVVTRFRADNPGYWLLHCHISLHSENGMIMILQVGQFREYSSFNHEKLPLCGGYPRRQPPDLLLPPEDIFDNETY